MNTNLLLECLQIYDKNTADHSNRVGHAAYLLAKKYGLPENFCKDIQIAGRLHDVGKMKIPLEILNKQGYLTDEERAIMNQHVSFGVRMLRDCSDCKSIYLRGAGEHHAYCNNTEKGYYASDIPNFTGPSFVAKIIALADVYDALSYKRSYKEALSQEKVLSILEANLMEGQFDLRLYHIFVKEVVPILQIEQGREFLSSLQKETESDALLSEILDNELTERE